MNNPKAELTRRLAEREAARRQLHRDAADRIRRKTQTA